MSTISSRLPLTGNVLTHFDDEEQVHVDHEFLLCRKPGTDSSDLVPLSPRPAPKPVATLDQEPHEPVDTAREATETAKAALKEAKKNARKERKRKAKVTQDRSIPSTPPQISARSGTPTDAFNLTSLKLLNPSTETLAFTPVPGTPALTATSSIPSVVDTSSSSFIDSLSRHPSLVSLEDPVAKAKAAVKKAKRQAKREANNKKDGDESTHSFASKARPTPQPWETALDNLEHFPSQLHVGRASRAAINAFKVPVDSQLLFDFNVSVPTRDFDISQSVVAAIVEDIIAKHGRWSITFSDPSYRVFLSTDKRAALSFKVCKGLTSRVAIVFGDPLCHPARLEEVIVEFRAFCRARQWRTAFVGVTEAVARVADAKRWTSVQFAVEQVVDPVQSELLNGMKGKRMLVAIKKLAKDNVLRMYNPADGVDPNLEGALQAVYDDSYSAKEATKGDTTAYSTKLALFDLARVMTYFYTVGPDGLPNGVAGLMNVGEGRYLLDPVVSLPDAPRDTSDFLTLSAMGWLRRRGVRHMSFGLEPLREIGDLRGLNRKWHDTTRMINAASYDAFGFSGKKTLHDKFYPEAAREQKLFLVLSSRNCFTQLDGAMAITNATHLKSSPVVEQLIRMTQAKHAGIAIEGMLEKLVGRGALSKHSSPSESFESSELSESSGSPESSESSVELTNDSPTPAI